MKINNFSLTGTMGFPETTRTVFIEMEFPAMGITEAKKEALRTLEALVNVQDQTPDSIYVELSQTICHIVLGTGRPTPKAEKSRYKRFKIIK